MAQIRNSVCPSIRSGKKGERIFISQGNHNDRIPGDMNLKLIKKKKTKEKTCPKRTVYCLYIHIEIELQSMSKTNFTLS